MALFLETAFLGNFKLDIHTESLLYLGIDLIENVLLGYVTCWRLRKLQSRLI